MFSSLRPDNIFYILHKGETPKLDIANVVNVSNQMPKYNTTFQPQIGNLETVVDVKVKVGEDTVDFKQLPSNLSIATVNNNVTVSDDRVAMSSEIESMLNNSRKIIDSVDYHKSVVTACEDLLVTLNPSIAKEKQQEEKINKLEGKMDNIENTLSDMKNILTQLTKTNTI